MTKKITLRKLAFGVLAMALFTSCKKDEDANPIAEASEYNYIRVLVTDESANSLTQLIPASGSTATFETKFPLGNLYPTASGRFAAVVHGSQNTTAFFDTGLEWHSDHVDVRGNARWAAITANGARPSHFKSKGTESIIFNDGDGTLQVANESVFNTPGATFTTINAGLQPHHGAMAQFDNGTYAVTTAPTNGGSPNRVQVINKSGSIVHASTVEGARLHGNATDGTNAVFGSFTGPDATTGGVLVVNQSGQQRMIANPDGFGAVRLGTILYGKAANKFVGFGGTKGAYLIDLNANRIVPIYEGTDVYQCKIDYAGKNLLLLTLDGKLRVYDLATQALKKEGMAIGSVAADEVYKPVLEATSNYAYIAQPATGEVHQISLSNFSEVVKHKVSAKPVRLTVLGFESNETH